MMGQSASSDGFPAGMQEQPTSSARFLSRFAKRKSHDAISLEDSFDGGISHPAHAATTYARSERQGLGISVPEAYEPRRQSTIPRVPVGSKVETSQSQSQSQSQSPDTPRSSQGLLDTPTSTRDSPRFNRGAFAKTVTFSPLAQQESMESQDSPRDDGRGEWQRVPFENQDALDRFEQPYDVHEGFDARGGFHDGQTLIDGSGHTGHYCDSRHDILNSRGSWLFNTILILSFYSTVMSGLWLVVAIVQPRMGDRISTLPNSLAPSGATLLTALLAKSIELSFVSVFIAFLGQALSRRAIRQQGSGLTLAQMSMRNWILQPGSLLTHASIVPMAVNWTVLGVVTLLVSVAATFYTTASDAMVSPKLMFGSWERTVLEGQYFASYANIGYAKKTCAHPLDEEDSVDGGGACMNVVFSGQSYRSLAAFMNEWSIINDNGTKTPDVVVDTRPVGTAILYDNTTLTSAWIETQYSNASALLESFGRVINNVTLAMPHPGVYAAGRDPVNRILQPDDLSGVGQYAIRAAVVSPAVNVLCASMTEEELAPLVYTTWEGAETERTGVGNQTMGVEGWDADLLAYYGDDYGNETAVDEVFRWGTKYGRKPPIWQMYPADYNILTNPMNIPGEGYADSSDSIYMLAKRADVPDYTLCQLRSWLSPNCSTHFHISGTSGSQMTAYCEDPDDGDSYRSSLADDVEWPAPSKDWRNFADQWRLSMDLNGGAYNNNASNARILTQLALTQPGLPTLFPSLAEALAVYSSSTLVIGSTYAPFKHWWSYQEGKIQGSYDVFNASVRTQEYTMGHEESWKGIFYVVLAVVFVTNLACLLFFLWTIKEGLVTDFTEAQNLFALAINSPPSTKLGGCCGGGPRKPELAVPWRVSYASSPNHYFFEEARERNLRRRSRSKLSLNSGTGKVENARGESYKRLSMGREWF